MINKIEEQDLEYIFHKLSTSEKDKFNGSTILMTGCGGFLGYYFLKFFVKYSNQLKIKKIIGLENFLTEDKEWLNRLSSTSSTLSLHKFDVIKDRLEDIPDIENVDLIIHAASVASPVFYRKYPLETIDANINGLRNLLDFYSQKPIRGFLFFSSSEVYGDPFPEFIPTPESYRGNVATTGPRACYDEAKRFGETLCYTFAQNFETPISVVRPFNNYGPGMSLLDKRLPADLCKAVLENRDITLLSDGSPKRTFCYISDAITGYLKVLLYGKFDIFNIGKDNPEISVKDFAEIYQQQGIRLLDYKGRINFAESEDKNYLVDNPNRRCPDLTKAREVLKYSPEINVETGIAKFLEFFKLKNSMSL